MPDIKLSRIPDRTTVKITLNLAPDVHRALAAYAELYEQIYGQNERIEDLIPAMLASFFESDRGFLKARRRMSDRPAGK